LLLFQRLFYLDCIVGREHPFKRNSAKIAVKLGLSRDGIGAIRLYTMKFAFYSIVNFYMRQADRELVVAFFPFIRLIMLELAKLPRYEGALLFRGIKGDFGKKFIAGKRFVEWAFVSCSTNPEVVLNSKTFFHGGSSDPVALLYFECNNLLAGTSITMFSQYPKEDEILMVPGFTYHIDNVELDANILRVNVRAPLLF
jgi:hypothetical protein